MAKRQPQRWKANDPRGWGGRFKSRDPAEDPTPPTGALNLETHPPLSLYDTLTNTILPLHTRRSGHVDMYVCGPTVYDHPHLGHARSAVIYDNLRRYLEWSGYKVKHVSNITDIDDKIINRARAENSTEQEVASKWETVYKDTMSQLGVLHPHEQPRATEWIDSMKSLVSALMDAGVTYTTDNGVYLKVKDIEGYGALTHRATDELSESGLARIEDDHHKEDHLDFALWKKAKPGEPSWPAPWGDGRPGWHIECAAMSLGILGDDFDLHGGGSDLVFPHHTNERAEALALGHSFARHWMHNAMLNIGGEKMSKSLSNYSTVEELLAEHPLNGRAFRLLVLQTHYRKIMEVNSDLLASARTAIQRVDALGRRLHAANNSSKKTLDSNIIEAFHKAMSQDLGTPEATSILFGTIKQANTAFDAGQPDAVRYALTARELANVLGIGDTSTNIYSDSDNAIEELVSRRVIARQNRDWSEADKLRDRLSAMGVVVEDTPDDSRWHRQDI